MFNYKSATEQQRMEEIKKISEQLSDPFILKSKEIQYLDEVLADDELIISIASGMMEQLNGIICLTNQRLLVLDKGIFSSIKQSSIYLSNIKAVSYSTGLILGDIKVSSGDKYYKLKNMGKVTVNRFSLLIEQQVEAYSKSKLDTDQSMTVEVEGDIFVKIEKLGELKEKGLISEDEFNTKKTVLLEQL